MKRFLLAALLVAACRPADGGSQNTPDAARRDTSASTQATNERADSLLQRADAGRIQGSRNAPVWIVEVSDFQCPYCKRWHDEVYPVIRREYIVPGHVRMAYLNLPLAQHQHAVPAAEAALCAAAQDKFWPMHDRLFETQERWADAAAAVVAAVFDSLAVATGVNAAEWRGCLQSQVMQRVINGDRTRAARSGVRSTPTFFVGDLPIEGAAPIDTFRVYIQRARVNASRAPPPSPQ